MNMLYDSESFVVVHFQPEAWPQLPVAAAQAVREDAAAPPLAAIAVSDASAAPSGDTTPRLARNGFEIVDKRSGREIYLDGSWAELFQAQIEAWQQKTPTQEEVEDTLERYTALAHQPVVVH
jgi:hypothetical protein